MGIDICIDIETIANVTPGIELAMVAGLKPRNGTKDEDKIAAQLKAKRDEIFERAALSPLTGQVCCVVAEEVDAPDSRLEVCGPDERALLDQLCGWLSLYDMPIKLVTFNGRRFDIPYLAVRCAIHEIQSAYRWPVGYSPHHADLCDVLNEHSLDLWATRFFETPKEHSGSEVQALWAAGKADVVLRHCVEDVRTTANLWRRIRGVIDERRK